MGGLLVGILAALIQIGVMVGIVVLIVKAVGGRDKSSTESAGVVIRRVFVYLIMLSMLAVVAIGLGGLIDAALPESGELVDSSADAARSISFVIVGLPILAGLALYTARRLKADPREQESTGWAFYLTVALLSSLLVTMALVGAAFSEIASGDTPERTTTITAVIWAGIWTAHWLILRRFPPKGAQVHVLVGSAIGLIWAFTGAIATVSALATTIYDGLFLDSLIGGGIDDLLRPAMILAVGLPVWWWYWFRHSRTADRTLLWNVYTLLLGVLGGVVVAVTGAGIMLFGFLEWFLGKVTISAAAHFDAVPAALAALLVGGAVWTYHAHVIGDRQDRSRDEVDRVYDYLVAAAGLVISASGVSTLIATALRGMGSRGFVATEGIGSTMAAALTLLAIGVPLWWHYWSTVQQYRRTNPKDELSSITRRIYIVGLFGVAAVIAVVSLIVIVFIVVEDVLDGAVGSGTVNDSAIAIALLATAGALAWYHFAVFREDREGMPTSESAEEEHSRDDLVLPGALEDAVAAVMAEGQATVTVTKVDDGYRLASADE